MIALRLAFKNVIGAGVRTWLNVFVLSAAYVMIIWVQGMIAGMDRAIVRAKIDYEIAGGQFWHPSYDPYDPLTFEESHGAPPRALEDLVSLGKATPILLATGAIYPQGRQQSAILCGIDPGQRILELPTSSLSDPSDGMTPAMIGVQLARETGLQEGNDLTVRWRSASGTFDAAEVRIIRVVDIGVPGVERGVIWIALGELREMLGMSGEASYLVAAQNLGPPPPEIGDWLWRDVDYLSRDIVELVRMKSRGSYILFGLMLFMGLLAVFDTQVLAIWHRRREIGTLMALGMERTTVIGLFTLEGALHGVLALAVGATYGIPILSWTLARGLPVPTMMGGMGMPVPHVLYPFYGVRLLVGTTILIVASVTVVSAMPASRIARLKPTDALRGKA